MASVNCISSLFAFTLITLYFADCTSNFVDYDGQASIARLVPVNSISIPPSAMKSERPLWQAPGCYRVGVTRTMRPKDCFPFTITTNACRGHCVSYSFPSSSTTLARNPKQSITSVGTCCNIVETVDIYAKDVLCVDGSNLVSRDILFKSALSCDCLSCKKE